MENVIIMYLSIAIYITLGESSIKITLKYLVFCQYGVGIWDPILFGR